MPDCHEAKTEAQGGSGQGGDAIGKTKRITNDDDGRPSQRCNRVKIRTQHLWYLHEENVARHAAADASQHAQKC